MDNLTLLYKINIPIKFLLITLQNGISLVKAIKMKKLSNLKKNNFMRMTLYYEKKNKSVIYLRSKIHHLIRWSLRRNWNPKEFSKT